MVDQEFINNLANLDEFRNLKQLSQIIKTPATGPKPGQVLKPSTSIRGNLNGADFDSFDDLDDQTQSIQEPGSGLKVNAGGVNIEYHTAYM
jgi:hypothetical protein